MPSVETHKKQRLWRRAGKFAPSGLIRRGGLTRVCATSPLLDLARSHVYKLIRAFGLERA